VVAELGGGQQDTEVFVERGIHGAHNVMRYLGMLEGIPELPARQMLAEERVVLRPHSGGMLLSDLDASRLTETVPSDTVLGRIISPYSFEELERFVAPYEASILALVRARVSPIEVGSYAFIVANGATACPL
jgi:hypothetical protein